MLKRLAYACGVLVLLLAAAGSAAVEDGKRVALVVGIGRYDHASELVNPRKDAEAIAGALRGLGFSVDIALDLDNRGLVSALRAFGVKAAEADVAVVYYAGHGVQVDGINYLVPSDAKLERVRDLLYEAVPLQLFLGEIAQARKLGLMMLDACRDNPFVDRLVHSMGAARTNQIGTGLARIDDTPSGTLVAMATRANTVAEDGQGEHSPYAEALLDELQVPGLELGLFFRRVRDRVLEATHGRQEPYTYGSLGAAPFYFNPKPPNRDPVVAAAVPLTVLDNAGPASLAIPAPTDPDGDRLVVQVAGLPRGGSVLVGDRTVLIGDYLTVEQLRSASFRPDGSLRGDAGTFAYVVIDGQGGSARGSVAVAIAPSNRPPDAIVELQMRAVVNRVPMPPPTDPDGDPLTIRVRRVPEHGTVRLAGGPLSPGDRIDPGRLDRLTFDPGDAAIGSSEQLVLVTDDGKGGEAVTTITITVTVGGEALPMATAEAPAARTQTPPPAAGPAEAASAVAEAVSGPPAPSDMVLEPLAGTFVALVDANLRSAPSSSAGRAGRVAKGAELTALGKVKDSNWFYVAPARGEPAFILGDLIAARPKGEPAPAATGEKMPADEKAAMVEPPEPAKPLARTNGDGASFQDCPECPVLVRIPAGRFVMGGTSGDRSERPPHQVTITKPFALGKYEVTVAQWRACVEDGGCPAMPRMQDPTDTTPVHNVHWQDAMAYVGWLQKKTGHRYRLPSEAEWEYAARAGTSSRYWWGEKIDGTKVACKDCGSTLFERLRPPAVDAQPPNAFGLSGMSGGVAEWVADCWFDSYRGAPADGSTREASGCRERVLRGGSWRDDPAYLGTTTRNFYDADVRYIANGFRVARDLD
ncbi:SUMF1/EgtB/PvdO family nonheme iron enzyme [Benzoatithermus flavus]|uniref:SUMF1/EgtB/PvdO family nonheme iron enzyme n=1 Tax=Benzoatithermus flavus TaxID=3108223 RepID=A0ABU8XT93_9PROT